VQVVPSGPSAWVSRKRSAWRARLLLVDDNATNRHILTLQTARWGMLPRAASSGAQALAWLDAGAGFDAAISTCRCRAWTATCWPPSCVRNLSAEPELPLLVLTSLGDDGCQLAGLGVAQTLTKPTKAQVLFDAAVRPVRATPPSSPQRRRATASSAPRLAQQVPLRCCWPRTTWSTSGWPH
jgi:CheY-like chemotaxis protein